MPRGLDLGETLGQDDQDIRLPTGRKHDGGVVSHDFRPAAPVRHQHVRRQERSHALPAKSSRSLRSSIAWHAAGEAISPGASRNSSVRRARAVVELFVPRAWARKSCSPRRMTIPALQGTPSMRSPARRPGAPAAHWPPGCCRERLCARAGRGPNGAPQRTRRTRGRNHRPDRGRRCSRPPDDPRGAAGRLRRRGRPPP